MESQKYIYHITAEIPHTRAEKEACIPRAGCIHGRECDAAPDNATRACILIRARSRHALIRNIPSGIRFRRVQANVHIYTRASASDEIFGLIGSHFSGSLFFARCVVNINFSFCGGLAIGLIRFYGFGF